MKNNSIPYILAIFSASLLVFSFPPFNLSLLAWIALIPLFFLLKESTPREAFLFYFLSGLSFWLYHIWWLTYVTFLGYSLLVVYLSSLFGFSGLLLKLLKERTNYPLVFLAPPLWILFEFIRTYLFTGFPWSLLGYSQWRNIPLIQISSITGVYGVSFLIVMVNAAVSDFIFLKTKKHLRNLIFSLLIIGAIVAVYERTILKVENNEPGKIKISVIQGNVPQAIKWYEGYEEQIIDTYTQLSIEAAKNTNPALIVWPETSYPDYVDDNSELFLRIKHLTSYTDIPLLMGAIHQKNGKDYNSAFLILPNGQIKQIYNKLHLVTFAEYIPLGKFFFFLRKTIPQIGDYTKGKEYTIFQIPPLEIAKQFQGLSPGNPLDFSGNTENRKPSFAVLICFEDLFPDLARRFTKEGANFLVVITNDAHFHESPALWQHFTHSVFRAVENRRPVIRAANNGISGFIDCYGRPIKILNENGEAVGVRGFATSQIITSSYKTFYTRFGDLFVYLNVLYLVILLIIMVKKNIKKL